MSSLNSNMDGWRAVADLGTNTFHLLVARKHGNAIEVGFNYKAGVQLGKGGMGSQLIAVAAQERAMVELMNFRDQIRVFGIDPEACLVLGTSAFRNAKNCNEFVVSIEQETGFRVQVISGEKEASYIFKGVVGSGALQALDRHLVMDIGGGSVEFILAQGLTPVWKRSFELGGLRLMEKFHQHDPISGFEVASLLTFAEQSLSELWTECERYKPNILVGCSGAFSTWAEMDAQRQDPTSIPMEENFRHMPLQNFKALHEVLCQSPLEKRLQIPGMIPLRAEMIVVAGLLTQLVILKTSVRAIRVSEWALQEGAMLEMLDLENADL